MNRITDLILSVLLSLMFAPFLVLLLFLASVSTRSTGLFQQERIGQHAQPFIIYKFRTMRNARVTGVGKFLRRTKLDELPQLFNILKGDMTFVGPRPDVPGYYDRLEGSDRRVLVLKPGLTSPAALTYRHEEELLNGKEDPKQFNDEVIFPHKVSMNLEYLDRRSLLYDLKIMGSTFISLFK